MNIKDVFQKISYLQYPLLVFASYFFIRPFIRDIAGLLNDINIGLAIYGIAVSISSLQDTTKVQNKASLKIYQNKTKTKIFLGYIAFMVVLFLVLGAWGLMDKGNKILHTLAWGFISLGIGFIGILKAAGEMAIFQQAKMDENNVGVL